MKIIILAAGRGERLMPLTRNTPKSLVDIGHGMTILEHQIENIQKCGKIDEIIIVVGYRGDQIESKIKMYQKGPLKIKTVFNPFFDVSNNLLSLWMAKHEMGDDFIIMNGDNLINSDAFNKIVDSNDEGIYVTIDKKETYSTDDMLVKMKNNRIIRIHKEIDKKEASAESVGLVRVTGEVARRRFVHEMDILARDESYRNKFWLEILNKLAENGIILTPVEIPPSEWVEVDYHHDTISMKRFMETQVKSLIEKKDS